MRHGFLLASLLGLALISPARADDAVKFTVHGRYFESNKSGLKGDSSYLFFPDKKAMEKVLRLAPPLLGGKKNDPVKDTSYTDGTVFAVIKRGMAITTYEVEKVTLQKDGVLVVTYTAKAGKEGTAKFASPLVVAVPKKDVKAIEFHENGKKVETVKVAR